MKPSALRALLKDLREGDVTYFRETKDGEVTIMRGSPPPKQADAPAKRPESRLVVPKELRDAGMTDDTIRDLYPHLRLDG